MDLRTIDRLREINRRFYSENAASFAATREHPWSGWEHLVGRIVALSGGSFLDIGCGSGRFLRYLRQHLGEGFAYLGIDASSTLLEAARPALPETGRLMRHDLVAGDLSTVLEGRSFDFVTLFGVLHHIPGRTARRQLISRALAALSPDGVLVLTFWRFLNSSRLRRRIVDWQSFNSRPGVDRIDPGHLEPGDRLLPWGVGDSILRYCHHADDDEVGTLLEELGSAPVQRFTADGGLNLYLLLDRGKGEANSLSGDLR